jgi:hypothetical protein
MKQIKYQSQAGLQRELSELNKLLILFNENDFILSSLNFKSLEEFECYVLSKTGFKNIQMSATAMGLDNEYNTILKNIDTIGGKITETDVVNKDFTKDFIQMITDKHTEYLNERDIKIAKAFKKMIEDYNKLDLKVEERQHITFDNYGNLVFNPFSFLKNV